MKIHLKRWLNFVVVFVILSGLWISLAAAAAPQINTASPAPIPGLLEPGNPTFALIVGAIVILTIVLTSSLLRLRRSR